MMVPRSYQYASAREGVLFSHNGGTQEGRGGSDEEKRSKKTKPTALRQSAGLLPTPSTASKPMIIPTRTKNQEKRTQKRSPLEETFNEKATEKHDVAELHASPRPVSPAAHRVGNQIPVRRKRRDRQKGSDNDNHACSMSSSSPRTWNLLLSAPDEGSFESASFESDATLGPKSFSAESMPALDEDQSSISSASNPATPGFVSERRRQKSLSTSLGQECASDHPLLLSQASPSAILESEEEEAVPEISQSPSPPPRSRTSFKSNLTASFRAMRSAAKSITDLAPPVRDDHLSRSILSLEVPYTSERRPTTSSSIPDAALRRYLNPLRLSPSELHFHGGEPEDSSSPCKSAVQMQSYRPGHRRSAHASSPPIFLSAAETGPENNKSSNYKQPQPLLEKNALDTEDPLTSSLLPKQREPRENSDFLRVIVLEMNMRKVGKISEANPGRARLWLPARETVASKTENGVDDGDARGRGRGRDAAGSLGGGGRAGKVPSRWVGVRP